MKFQLSVCALLLPLLACGSDNGADVDDGADAAVIDAGPPMNDADLTPDASAVPMSLEESGLYEDFDLRTLAPGVREYRPAFELWSDGADKARYVYLPEGTQIDVTDMNFWSFPEGTKLWKDFSVDGKLLETRLLWKDGPDGDDWYFISFAWNEDESATTAVPLGESDVRATNHDIPEQRDCRKCHGRQPTYPLGFSAIQLDHDGPGVTLADLVSEGRLSSPITAGAGEAFFPLPGSTEDQAVLGYLHANCGGCHNPTSDVQDTNNALFHLDVNKLGTLEATDTFTSTVAQTPALGPDGATAIIDPGEPNTSSVVMRMELRGDTDQMPPRGSEVEDTTFVTALRAWITALPEPAP